MVSKGNKGGIGYGIIGQMDGIEEVLEIERGKREEGWLNEALLKWREAEADERYFCWFIQRYLEMKGADYYEKRN